MSSAYLRLLIFLPGCCSPWGRKEWDMTERLNINSEACGILASQPGIEPVSPALQGRLPTTGPPGKPLTVFSDFLSSWCSDIWGADDRWPEGNCSSHGQFISRDSKQPFMCKLTSPDRTQPHLLSLALDSRLIFPCLNHPRASIRSLRAVPPTPELAEMIQTSQS